MVHFISISRGLNPLGFPSSSPPTILQHKPLLPGTRHLKLNTVPSFNIDLYRFCKYHSRFKKGFFQLFQRFTLYCHLKLHYLQKLLMDDKKKKKHWNFGNRKCLLKDKKWLFEGEEKKCLSDFKTAFHLLYVLTYRQWKLYWPTTQSKITTKKILLFKYQDLQSVQKQYVTYKSGYSTF